MRSRLLLCGLVAIALPALAGCGNAASSGPAAGAGGSVPTAPALRDDSPQLVLQADQLGGGFVLLTKATKPITLKHELQHEGAAARAADRRSYLGGYETGFSGNGMVVLSEAAAYREASDAAITIGDKTGLHYALKEFHAHKVKAPADSPGQDGVALVGAVPSGGRTYPLHAYMWRSGNHLGGVFVIGGGITSEQVAQYAAAQNSQYPA